MADRTCGRNPMNATGDWNYLNRIVEFYSRQQVFPLSARGQALYHLFLWHCNMARGRQPLTLSELLLRSELGISHQKFLAVRKELVNGGYIRAQSRQGRLACQYYLPDLSGKEEVEPFDDMEY